MLVILTTGIADVLQPIGSREEESFAIRMRKERFKQNIQYHRVRSERLKKSLVRKYRVVGSVSSACLGTIRIIRDTFLDIFRDPPPLHGV
jgi:hypothetical protein